MPETITTAGAMWMYWWNSQEPISLIRLVALEQYLTSLVGIRVDGVPKEDIRRELRDSIVQEAVYV